MKDITTPEASTEPAPEKPPKKRSKKQGHFIRLDDEFVDHGYMRMLSSSAVSVYVALQRHRQKSNSIKIGAGRLGDEIGLSRRAVVYAIGELVGLGLIDVSRNNQWINTYHVLTLPKQKPAFEEIDIRKPASKTPMVRWVTDDGKQRLMQLRGGADDISVI